MSKRVLVIDDDQQIREIISFALSHNGYVVTVADNGQRLAELLEQDTPDLIILDVMMPGLDGYQLFGQLRRSASTCTTPIIIMTAHDEGIYERISKDLGASEHITKPFHPLRLVERVQELLQSEPEL